MKRFRLRLSSLLWLVAIAAALLGGIRYGEYRAATRRQSIVDPLDAIVVFSPDGKVVEFDKLEVTKNPNTVKPATGP